MYALKYFLYKTLYKIQSAFRDTKISTFTKDCTHKVVIRELYIPIDITDDEITTELEFRGFTVKYFKRFSANSRSLTICFVILTKTPQVATIYEVNGILFLLIRVEAFKKSGLLQCFLCQRFDHRSRNCSHALRCVKCSGEKVAKKFSKSHEESPSCYNCSGNHMANF